MYPAAESESKKEPWFVDEDYFFLTVFTGEAPIAGNTFIGMHLYSSRNVWL